MKAIICLLVIVAFCSAEDALKTDDDIMLAYTKMQAQQKYDAKHALLMGVQEAAPAEILLEEVPKAASNFAKVPAWVSTEDDLEAFLQQEQQRGTKIVRKENGVATEAMSLLWSKHGRYRGRRPRLSVVKRWKKVKKSIKLCEVKVKGAKWNRIRGQCRGALRFCVLYRKFAKRFRMPSLLHVAKRHCSKARKMHRKLWGAAVKAARKARAARLKKCLKSKRCRRAYYRRLRRQARRKHYAAHRRCMKKKKCRAAWIRRRRWAAKRRLARHKKCMKNPKCRKGFFAHRARVRKARLDRYRRRVARHKACMKNAKCKKRFFAHRRARRASRRRAHIRCMKNKACKKRYHAWRKRRAARRAAWKKRRAARRKGRKGKKGKKKKAKKGKKKKKKAKKGKKKKKKKAKKGKKGKKRKGKFFNRHLKKMRTKLAKKNLRAKKKDLDPEMFFMQYTKFPTWVETEDDMEAYFKQQHTKVVRKDSGNGGVNPSGRKFVVEVQTKKTVEAEEAPISLLEEPTEGSTPAVKDRMQRIAKLNKRMANAGANKLIEERSTTIKLISSDTGLLGQALTFFNHDFKSSLMSLRVSAPHFLRHVPLCTRHVSMAG